MRFYKNAKSGWQDSNLRPPAPKAGAMTGLRYTPKSEGKYNIKSKYSKPQLYILHKLFW